MTTAKVAEKARVGIRTVQRWAAENGVEYTGEGRRKDYNFSAEDYDRFSKRPAPGHPRLEPEKTSRRKKKG
jgi:DNA-binding transcriptional MerR regulator